MHGQDLKPCPLIKGELGMTLHAILCDVSRSYLAIVSTIVQSYGLHPVLLIPIVADY